MHGKSLKYLALTALLSLSGSTLHIARDADTTQTTSMSCSHASMTIRLLVIKIELASWQYRRHGVSQNEASANCRPQQRSERHSRGRFDRYFIWTETRSGPELEENTGFEVSVQFKNFKKAKRTGTA